MRALNGGGFSARGGTTAPIGGRCLMGDGTAVPQGRGELRDKPPPTRIRQPIRTLTPHPLAAPHRNAPGEIPSSSPNSRSPDGVTLTARSDPIRTHHPASSACRHSAAPAAPAR